ncbi:proline dehydrogenase family protein [Tunicatimonas pelagia]|uniref:proline dehydrogenase family protein n=1 Tax=Tunicatimonas pelagia TaxID=931531 RepID=UPI00266532B8|nr:proline dehydrogenase family protein [Tunicatimonas pelagia]WKN45238.1 proline dehydrogenase family protein [Tunicatimonas pelagia]
MEYILTEASPVSFDNTEIAFSYKSNLDLRKTYWLFKSINYPFLTNIGTKVVKIALKLKLPIHGVLKHTLFQQFCGGETIADCTDTIQMLASHNVKTILDYSVEVKKTEEGFEHTTEETLRVIEAAQHTPDMPFCAFKMTGIMQFELMARVQAGQSLSAEQEAAFNRGKARLERLCEAAYQADVGIFIDGEESWIQEVIDSLANEMMQRYNQKKVIVYNTYQMYRHEMLDNLKKAYRQAVTHQYHLGVKLVRGAYMEKERDRAQEQGYTDPIQPNKEATDEDYNRALLYCLNHKQRISLCSGSHNEYSNYYLTMLMEKHSVKPSDPRIYFAQLYGMSDNISFNLSRTGYNVAKYLPYGPLEAVMPYLFRRAEENTSVRGQSSRELTMVSQEMKRRKRN